MTEHLTDIPPALKGLATDLRAAIHAEAASIAPSRPPVDELLGRPGTAVDGRRRRRGVVVALAAAAAVALVVGVVATRPSDQGAVIDTTDDVAPAPNWRVHLDPSSGWSLGEALPDRPVDRAPDESTSRPTFSIVYHRPGAATSAPWLALVLLTGPHHLDAAHMPSPLTLGDHHGFDQGYASTDEGPVGMAEMVLDDDHVVTLQYWGLSRDTALSVLASARLGGDTLVVGSPPAGLDSSTSDGTQLEQIQRVGYWRRDDNRSSHHLFVTTYRAPVADVDEVATSLKLSAAFGRSPASSPPGVGGTVPSGMDGFTTVPFSRGEATAVRATSFGQTSLVVVWNDRPHGRVIEVQWDDEGATTGDGEIRRVLDALVDIDEAGWAELRRRCPASVTEGTANPTPTTAIGSC